MGIVGNLSPDQLQYFDSQGNQNRFTKPWRAVFVIFYSFPLSYFISFCIGYLVIESFASPEEMDAMRRRMDQLLDEFDYSTVSIFSTKNQVFVQNWIHFVIPNQCESKFFLFLDCKRSILNLLLGLCFPATVNGQLLLRECWERFFFLRGYALTGLSLAIYYSSTLPAFIKLYRPFCYPWGLCVTVSFILLLFCPFLLDCCQYFLRKHLCFYKVYFSFLTVKRLQ